MKIFSIIFLTFFCSLSAQKTLPLDSLKFAETQDFFADDYGNIYFYKNKNFSFTKYDSLGKELGRMMLTLPFKVQNVQNPLNIVLFSENAQEMKFVDQNLNEIQKLDLRKFGFVQMAFAEDQQQIWILDESQKSLVQYNFREDKIINSYPFYMEYDDILDLIVFENKLFILTEKSFKVFDFKTNLLFEKPIVNGRKLRRENEFIFVVSKNSVSKFRFPDHFEDVFQGKNSKIVDKNSSAYFELTSSKLYIYHFVK